MLHYFLRCISLLLLGISIHASAEETFFTNRAAVTRFHYGYVWAHRDRMDHMVTGHTTGFEISLQRQTDGSKWWQLVHGYPQTGISLIHLDYSNEVIGNATGLIAYMNFPFVKTPSFLFSLRAGAGLGYLSRRFDAETDHKNMGIGSHINSAIQFNIETRYRLSQKFLLNLNYGITHFSNGSYRLPNLGVNNVSLNGGITWLFNGPTTFKHAEIPPPDRRIGFEIFYGAGVKENYPPDGKQYFAHSLVFQFRKPLSHKCIITLGPDIFYDLSLLRFVRNDLSAGERPMEIIRGGIHAGFEMPVNRLTLVFHAGYYLYDKTKIDTDAYNRYGLNYLVSKHFFINFTLKTHFARADYVEAGIGWRLN